MTMETGGVWELDVLVWKKEKDLVIVASLACC